MGLNVLSVEDTPAFDHSTTTLTKESAYVRCAARGRDSVSSPASPVCVDGQWAQRRKLRMYTQSCLPYTAPAALMHAPSQHPVSHQGERVWGGQWRSEQTRMLAAALRGYGEALDPRLRRAPPLGLGGGLAQFTAPLLDALSRPDDVRCASPPLPPESETIQASSELDQLRRLRLGLKTSQRCHSTLDNASGS